MKKYWFLTLLILMRGMVIGATLSDDLFKEAQIQETTARDPQKAIDLYTQYIAQPNAPHALQADAYLHIGLCHLQLGRPEDAKAAWKKIVQDYSDQKDDYAAALDQLQKLQTSEVHASTPVVKVVYTAPPTRWALEWMDFTYYHVVDSKGQFFSYFGEGEALNLPHSLEYYVRPSVAIGLEGRRLFSSDESFHNDPLNSFPSSSVSRSVAYMGPVVRIEKRYPFGLTPFVKFGPAAYRFHFDGSFGSSTKWAPGMTSEAGLTLGWSRGFTLSVGYSLLGFVQETPDIDFSGVSQNFPWDNSGTITQAHGWRWVGGPSLKLGFRW